MKTQLDRIEEKLDMILKALGVTGHTRPELEQRADAKLLKLAQKRSKKGE